MASNKLPAFQWYVGDWRKDPGVQALDYFSRGVWLEILMLMHESDERGVLLLNRQPMPEDALARLLGLDKQKITEVITTLLSYGVASRDNRGALINRRMVRDEVLRQARKQAGKRGGNPNFAKGKKNPYYRDNQKDKQIDKQIDKQKITPSSSSSSSSSSSKVCISAEGKILHGKFCYLSESDYESYLITHGKAFLNRALEKLDAWIESDPTPKRLKNGQNASACFRSWVFNAIAEEQGRKSNLGQIQKKQTPAQKTFETASKMYLREKAKEEQDEKNRVNQNPHNS